MIGNGKYAGTIKIGFAGLGNMASAIIGSIVHDPDVYLKSDVYNVDLYGYDINSDAIKNNSDKVTIVNSYSELLQNSDYIVLAVKPQVIASVIDEIKLIEGNEDKVYISIVAGKSLDWYEGAFGSERKIARCMPNTAALVGEAATAMTPSKNLGDSKGIECIIAETIVGKFGKCIKVPEHLMDAVVGVSGSAPAYVFMFIEAMADAAVVGGMPRKQAYEFAAQAVYGSAKLMLETGKHPGELKDMVCSPAGTTIDAVRVLEEKNFRGAVMDAVIAATEKSKNL